MPAFAAGPSGSTLRTGHPLPGPIAAPSAPLTLVWGQPSISAHAGGNSDTGGITMVTVTSSYSVGYGPGFSNPAGLSPGVPGAAAVDGDALGPGNSRTKPKYDTRSAASTRRRIISLPVIVPARSGV